MVRVIRSAKPTIDAYVNELMKRANVKEPSDLLPKEEGSEVLLRLCG